MELKEDDFSRATASKKIKKEGHFSAHAQIIKRSEGRSAVAAAAYRAGEKLFDDRLGRSFNWSSKKDVVDSWIMAPENAPEWVFDRAILWNNVEAKEDTSTRRASAQPAREIRFSIAREIPMALAPPLVRQFVQKNFVNQGMIADVAIHNPNAKDGGKNPHFHVMLTTRHIDTNDPHGFGNKNRDWNEHTLQTQWRENWAATQNAYFEKNEIEVSVSSKSNKERGIDRQSTNIPISAYKMEERNLRTNAGDQARETHEYNRMTQIAINTAQWVRGKSNNLMHIIREYYYGYNIGNTQKSAEQAQHKSKQKNQGLDR